MKTRPLSTFLATCLLLTIAFSTGCGGGPTESSDLPPKMAKMVADYPLQTCVVTGNKLGEHGQPHDILYQGELVRFCCASCVKSFNEDPAGYVAKIHPSAKAPAPSR